MNKHVDKIKTHFKENKKTYIIVGSCVIVVAGFTCLIMRRNSQHIRGDVIVPAQGDAIVLGKSVENSIIFLGENKGTLNNVSYISANRPGPPSWVVRCLETDMLFTSQKKAALEMDITPSNISRHLNGLQETAEGYHFERICMDA